MAHSLKFFADGYIVEFEDDQPIRAVCTEGRVKGLSQVLKFSRATGYSLAPADQISPVLDIVQPRGGRHINSAGIKLITAFEGCDLNAYRDSVGVWTIGYGHTEAVQEGMTISQAQAEQFLQADLKMFEHAVEEAVTVEIDENQFAALVSFSFNLGAGSLFESTLLQLLNAGDVFGATAEFPKWNKAGGQPLLGLTRRRKAEQALFSGHSWEPFLAYEELSVRVLQLTTPPMQGEDVRQVQFALSKAGFNLILDGSFGHDTERAVRQFQQQKQIDVDGKVGATTRTALGL